MSTISVIGRECTTEEHFTAMLTQSLGFPEVRRPPGESDERFLIRRLEPLKWCSRHWALAHLDRLPPKLLELAAMQICNAAADYCQDRACERHERERQEAAR
jgi:hypothetical protein